MLKLVLLGRKNASVYQAIGKSLEEIPVVCLYPDVFPDELPCMPPDRAVELKIELQPGTAPILEDHIECHRMSWQN